MVILCALGGAAVIVGAALWNERGPDLSLVPEMVPHKMVDGHGLWVQTHEVTLADWNLCAQDGGCALTLRPPPGRAASDFPATGISWLDAQEYLAWINRKTGQGLRLPTRAEWADMAAEVMPETPDPIFTDPNLTWASAYLIEGLQDRRLEPTGHYAVTGDGIADLDGNVWEWTESCYDDGREGITMDRCPAFYAMGVHEAVMSFLVRDPALGGCAMGAPPAHLGMRLVADRAPSKG